MIQYSRTILDNGLTVLVHEDRTTPMVAVNLLYKVGSKHDPCDKTGLAHLLEHMMFTGSSNAPDFDTPMQLASGENNAFTNKDITNYYELLPAENLKTALWLESDRMQDLVLSKDAFLTQQSVVIEEFKETCLNQPYGMVWHHLLDLAYQVHPYQWPTIGINEQHIQKIGLEDLKNYYTHYYTPNNAILTLGGNLSKDQSIALAAEWFGDLDPMNPQTSETIVEPNQRAMRFKEVHEDVPVDVLFLAFHMPGRIHSTYYAADFISDILGNGKSSRLYQKLVLDRKIFLSIDAYVTGNTDPGLLIIEGKLASGTTHEEAANSIWEELERLKSKEIESKELSKILNQMLSAVAFSNTSLLNNVMNLSFFEYLGDANLVNSEPDVYGKVTPNEIQEVANSILQKANCSQLNIKGNA
ncbi:MAG: insulinase family protein [Bacteroidia bacterium]|nr:insulinase family protein [Bacteroidia bacterium]